jgi:DNA-directed RNA polymerase specialized sigma24 family protein
VTRVELTQAILGNSQNCKRADYLEKVFRFLHQISSPQREEEYVETSLSRRERFMPDGRGKPDDGENIKRLLVSQSMEDRLIGLVLVDKEYRKLIGASVRSLSNREDLQLSPVELAEIWQETLKALVLNVMTGTFAFEGRLDAYLRTIAWRRAFDVRRWRRRNKQDDKLETMPDQEATSITDFFEELDRCYVQLPDTQHVAVRFYIDQCHAGAGVRPTMVELTKAFNAQYGVSLSVKTMTSRVVRGMAALRSILQRRGHGK